MIRVTQDIPNKHKTLIMNDIKIVYILIKTYYLIVKLDDQDRNYCKSYPRYLGQ